MCQHYYCGTAVQLTEYDAKKMGRREEARMCLRGK